MENKYTNGKIYEIVSGGKRYIGSTYEKLSRRLSRHRSNKKANKAGKREWTSCYDILDEPDCKINLLLEYPCNSKEELRRKEGEYILSLDCINKVVAGRTNEEYREITRDTNNAKSSVKKKQKVKCNKCNKIFSKGSLYKHKKVCELIKVSKSGYKNIYKLTEKSYTVQMSVNGKRICKNFSTIEEALQFRDTNK